MNKQITKSNKVIKHHVVMSMAAGMIPFAGVDMLAVGKLQIDMLKRLCNLFGESFEDMSSQAYICTISGTATARVGATFIKTIPIIGTAIGGVSMSVMAGASTYALGQMFVRYLDDEELFDNINSDKAKSLFRHYYKRFLRTFKKTSKTEANIESFIDLVKLRKDGVITEQSFQTMKVEILDEFKTLKLSTVEAIETIKRLSEYRDSTGITKEEFEFLKESILEKL